MDLYRLALSSAAQIITMTMLEPRLTLCCDCRHHHHRRSLRIESAANCNWGSGSAPLLLCILYGYRHLHCTYTQEEQDEEQVEVLCNTTLLRVVSPIHSVHYTIQPLQELIAFLFLPRHSQRFLTPRALRVRTFTPSWSAAPSRIRRELGKKRHIGSNPSMWYHYVQRTRVLHGSLQTTLVIYLIKQQLPWAGFIAVPLPPPRVLCVDDLWLDLLVLVLALGESQRRTAQEVAEAEEHELWSTSKHGAKLLRLNDRRRRWLNPRCSRC